MNRSPVNSESPSLDEASKPSSPHPIVILNRVSFLMVIMLVLTALGLSSCAFSENPGAQDQAKINNLEQQLDANRPLTRADFKHEFIPGAQPNVYTAKISWPAGRPLSVRIRKPNNGGIDTFDGRLTNSFMISCSGQQVRYAVDVLSASSEIIGSFDIAELCPTDFVVVNESSAAAIPANLNGRLFLNNGAVLTVSDQPLKLYLLEIIVDGAATIRTFSRDRQWIQAGAVAGSVVQETLAPPKIQIQAKKATGALKLELNGIDGKKVMDRTPDIDVSRNGAKGTPGDFSVRTKKSACKRGSDLCYEEQEFTCTRLVGNGMPGKSMADQKAMKGVNANPGVGTSKVSITVVDVSQFTMEVQLNPGMASAPGKGSFIQGGAGGPPGENPRPETCANGVKGDDGDNSPKADDGDPAPNGTCSPITLSRELAAKTRVTDDPNTQLKCTKNPMLVQVL